MIDEGFTFCKSFFCLADGQCYHRTSRRKWFVDNTNHTG